jgi:hypothetical protein
MAFLLAGTWIAGVLWPFSLALDLGHVGAAIEPLLHPDLAPLEILRYGTCWLAFASLCQAAVPGQFSRTLAFIATLAGPFAALAVEGRTTTLASVLGAGLAVVTSLALSGRSAKASARWLAILLAATILGVGLAPYEFVDTSRQFDWIPFSDYLDSSILGASGALLTKAFLFGSLVWASSQAGLRLIVVGALVSGLLLAIGWAQMYLPGQSPGITDALIALCMTLATQFFRAPAHSVARTTTQVSSRTQASSVGTPAGAADR